ncbi:MAG: hypothetical protein ACM3JD_01535, partial [Rudaea sp.]
MPTFASVVVETATLASAEIPTITPLAAATQAPVATLQAQPTDLPSLTPTAPLPPTFTPLPTLTSAPAAESTRAPTGIS